MKMEHDDGALEVCRIVTGQMGVRDGLRPAFGFVRGIVTDIVTPSPRPDQKPNGGLKDGGALVALDEVLGSEEKAALEGSVLDHQGRTGAVGAHSDDIHQSKDVRSCRANAALAAEATPVAGVADPRFADGVHCDRSI